VGGGGLVENEKTRTWAARLAAPLAFAAAAIVLILLVQSGLRADDSETGTTATPTATTQGGTTTVATQRKRYRVQRGDTLESIAAKFGTTVEALIELNPDIDPLALSPGQRIRVS
jgi:LysM repeat protein